MVQVAVIDQEWLRISAEDPQPGMDGDGLLYGQRRQGQLDGHGRGHRGGRFDPGADQITTTNTTITVSGAGDSAAVPVLAGDASSTGLALSLAGVPPTATACDYRAYRLRPGREPPD